MLAKSLTFIHDKIIFIHDKILVIHDEIIFIHDKIIFDPRQNSFLIMTELFFSSLQNFFLFYEKILSVVAKFFFSP